MHKNRSLHVPKLVVSPCFAVMIVGNNSETIRGFLVQGMTVTDSSAVGTFVDLPALVPGTTNVNARVGDCLPAASSATHMQPGNRTLREDFPYVALNWTAPPSQTGDVQFRYVAHAARAVQVL